jgi:outer membrane cobalamin receptor
MYKRTAMLLALAALALSAVMGAAQDATLSLDQIVVTATRIAGTILASPDHITVVNGEQLASAVSVADALQQAAGVSVADNGTAGSVQSLSLRGSTAPQVLVLVDGVRLNDSRQGGADLSMIPVDNIQRVEIVRGGTSALYGADAVAGVVNIITKDKAAQPFKLTVINGSYIPREAIKVTSYDSFTDTSVSAPTKANYLDLLDTQRVGAQLSQKLGAADLLLTSSFTRANNGFVWYDRQVADGYRRRFNSGLLQGDATMSVSAPAGEGRAGLKLQAGYSNTGVPGSVTYVLTEAEQQSSLLQAQAFFQTPQLGSSPLSLDAHLFYKYSGLGYQSPETSEDDLHNLHTVGLDLSQKFAAADWLQLVYGGNALFDGVDSTAIGRHTRMSGGAFVEAPFYLSSWLTLTPMVRFDLYSDFPASLTYKLAAVARLSENVSLKASAARSYRAPTLNDLYWTDAFGDIGNPNLRPETGYTGELGLTAIRGPLEANLFGFTRYVIDGIQWFEFAPYVYQPANIGEAIFPGAEADLSLLLFPGVRLTGSYTFLYSFVLKGASASYSYADDKRATYAPVHKASLGLGYEGKRTRLGVNAEYVGERFANEANTTRLPPYLVLNAEARRVISEHLALTLEGKNLLNQVYQTVDGYVMPPLSFWVGAELRL